MQVQIGMIVIMVMSMLAFDNGAAAAEHELDAVHSAVIFRVQHVGISYTYGRFNEMSGVIGFDKNDLAATKFDITIKAASVDTGNAQRDNHLRGPDFFNAGQFPEIRFKSTKTELAEDGKVLNVTGQLSLHGVTKTVTVPITVTGHGDRGPRFGYRAGFESKFTIQRSDYGMTFGVENGAVGDEVTLMIAFESILKK